MISASARGPPVDAAITTTRVARAAGARVGRRRALGGRVRLAPAPDAAQVHLIGGAQRLEQLLAHRAQVEADRARRLAHEIHRA